MCVPEDKAEERLGGTYYSQADWHQSLESGYETHDLQERDH